MKHDWDLVRLLLLALESSEGESPGAPVIPGYCAEQVEYHLHLLVEAGYIYSSEALGTGLEFCWLRLTWAGHDFLDAARPLARWQKAKSMLERSGGVTLQIFSDVLTSLIKQQLGL